jgi:DNA uptake protein ComE-like DNA-binding protein
MTREWSLTAVALAAAVLLVSAGAGAQVGKSLGVKDVNVVPEQELAAIPGMTAAIAKGLVERRPFASLTDLNAYLLGQGLAQAQAMELYQHAIVHVNLNTATREEILLIPGAGPRMAHEFDEYRPWRSWAQYDREISKYVGQEATDRLKQYVFIPLNVNTASDEDLVTIPGVTAQTLARIKEGRPYASTAQLEQRLAEGGDPKEAARVARFVVVP